jgi:hypothetical protein
MLQRDPAIQTRVARETHLARASGAEPFNDARRTDRGVLQSTSAGINGAVDGGETG